MSLDLRHRLFAELDSSSSSIRTRTSTRSIRPRTRWPTSWATTTTPSWPTRPACRKSQIEEPGLDPKEKVRRLIENLGPMREHDSVQLARRDVPDVFRPAATTASRRRTGKRVYDAAELLMAHSDWADAGAQAEPARSGLPDQRLRRSARRLRHERLYPLPADRRPGVSSGQARSSPAAGKSQRHRADRRPLSAPRHRRSCSSISSRAARGPVRSRCRPISRRSKVSLARANTALAAIIADGPAAAESHRRAIAQLRLLDARRNVRRVQAAVRPDDRRQSRRL